MPVKSFVGLSGTALIFFASLRQRETDQLLNVRSLFILARFAAISSRGCGTVERGMFFSVFEFRRG